MCVFLSWIEKMVDVFFAVTPRAKPSPYKAKQALLIAHRGAHNLNQGIFENTRQAFLRAKDLGCWGIEFDVHTTADGVFVVNHDPDLLRLWRRDEVIAELTFSELRQLVPEIPSLAEVVAEFGDSLHLFIELKVPIVHPQRLFDVLASCDALIDYHLLTLNPSFYNSLSQFPSAALLLVAGHNNVSHLCDLSIARHYGGVLGNYLLLSNKKIHKLVQAQQRTGVGLINSKNSLYRELNRDINWLFTNEAQQVCHYLHLLK
jgi:glycerophosphoryl diester phosphodiesterase